MNAKRKGRTFGYARVSSEGQDLTIQIEALERAGCDVIRPEKVSGTSRKGRTELETLLQFLGDGDTLVVTRVDRLARSIGDLQDIVRELKAKGVTLRCTEQPIDTGTAAGKAFLDMLGVFAEFETNLRRERQLEGIDKAKKRGVYRGRAHGVDAKQVQELKAAGKTPTAIAKELGIARASVYLALKVAPDRAAEISEEIAERAKRAKKDEQAKAGERKPAEPARTAPELIIRKPTIRRIETHIAVQPPPTPNRAMPWREAGKPAEAKRPSRA